MPVRILEAPTIGDRFPIRRPATIEQTAITATSSSQQSAAFNATTGIIYVQADEAVHIKIGANPTATTNSFKLNGGDTHDWIVTPGDKLAVRTA